MAESAGLLFKIKGDESDAVRALKNTERAADGLTASTKNLAKESNAASVALGNFIGNLGAAAVQELTAQMIAGAKAVFNYTARMEQTKIGFATLMGGAEAANKHLAELQKFAQDTPFEFEDLTIASRRLQNVGLEAEKIIPVMRDIGNAAAAAGASSAELDSITLAFSQIIAKGKLSAEEVNQLAERGIPVWRMLSQELGKSKGEIIKLAEEGKISSEIFLAAFQRFSQAKFGDAMAKQAKTFQGAMSTIKDITMLTASTAFEPLYKEISLIAVKASKLLDKQKGDFSKIGSTLGEAAGTAFGLALGTAIRVSFLELAKGMGATAGANPGAFWGGLLGLGKGVVKGIGGTRAPGQVGDVIPDYSRPQDRKAAQSNTPFVIPGEGEEEAKKKAKEAALIAERDLTAQISIEAINLQTIQDGTLQNYEKIRKTLGEGASIVSFVQATNKETVNWQDNLKRSLAWIEALEQRQLGAEATEHERALLVQQQAKRRNEIEKLGQDELEKNEKAIHDERTKRWEERLKQGEEESAAAQKRFEAEMDRQRQLQEQRDKDFGYGQIPGLALAPLLNPLQNDDGSTEQDGPFDAWTRSWDEFFTRISEEAPTISALFEDLGGIMQGAFEGLAQSIGSVVQQWVIYGNTGPAVMRKMLAAVLASVAAEAAVKAIMATAEGFYFLATHQYDSAANAFIAAGFYGAVAGVAALAGRAVAGDSFKQQSNRATGSSSSSGQGSHGNQGQAYSPYGTEATVYEQSRNAPAAGIKVTVSDDSQWLGKMLKFQIETNAGVRDMIKGVAEG